MDMNKMVKALYATNQTVNHEHIGERAGATLCHNFALGYLRTHPEASMTDFMNAIEEWQVAMIHGYDNELDFILDHYRTEISRK